jgi:uridine phosphorylase
MKARGGERAGRIEESELILDADGSVYHLRLRPEQIADTVILVGDPGRVEQVSKRFDAVECRVAHREFVTHTGRLGGLRLSVAATGIGTDNIDIVLTELDALVNVDLAERAVKADHTALRLVRLGTSGALHHDIPIDQGVVSRYALGLDGLLGFYAHEPEPDEVDLLRAFRAQVGWDSRLNPPYVVRGAAPLLERLGVGLVPGITVTANGFFGPQGRSVRLSLRDPGLNDRFARFAHAGLRLTNYEMECSALYGLSALMGHEACTICLIIANRPARRVSADPKRAMDVLIDHLLERLTSP